MARPAGRNRRITAKRGEMEQYVRAGTLTQAAIARRFGVSTATVSRIATGKAARLTFEPKTVSGDVQNPRPETADDLAVTRRTLPIKLQRPAVYPKTGCGICSRDDLERSPCPHRRGYPPTTGHLDHTYERAGRRSPAYRAILAEWVAEAWADDIRNLNEAFDRAMAGWQRRHPNNG